MIFNQSYYQLPLVNAAEILTHTALLGIFALGAGIVIISGGIDLSSGSVIAFSGSICGLLMMAFSPVDENGVRDMEALAGGWIGLAICISIFVGLLVGTFHAWLITVVGLPPFVATLASLVGLRSLARIMNKAVTKSLVGRDITKLTLDSDGFLLLRHWSVPLSVFLVLSAGAWLLLNRSVIGRHLFAMGGNEEAARLSGIRTDRLKWLAYVMGAVTASIAGVLYAARVGSVDPVTMGLGYELNAIAAAVVGGCSLSGGIGAVGGIMLGVFFLRVVIDSVSKLFKGNPDESEGLIVGILIVLAVALNELRARDGGRKTFFPGVLGTLTIGILAILVGLVAQTLIVGDFHSAAVGLYAGTTTLVVLIAVKLVERSK